MSTEAKQAADWKPIDGCPAVLDYGEGTINLENPQCVKSIANAHNAATAKLRGELEELRSASFHDVSENLARMAIEYVEGGIKLGTDWRNGLSSVIALRLKRLQMDKDQQLAHQSEQEYVHIERYFPKGYNPNDEPWLSIRKHYRIAEKQMAVLERS